MWGNRFTIKMWLFSLSIMLASIGCWRLGKEIFSIQSHQCLLSASFSTETKKNIKALIAHYYTKSFEQMVHALKEKCPAIKTVAMQRCANHQLRISLDTYAPTMKLGDGAVLLENNSIVAAAHFTSKVLNQLPAVDLKKEANPQLLSLECRAWLNKLDKDILESYTLAWEDDYQIYCKQKNNPARVIIAGVNTALEKEIIEVCQHIIDEKIQLGQGTARVSWSADIRFDKQIIVSSHKGGACHG